jgi:AraC-like DNA-binding protein
VTSAVPVEAATAGDGPAEFLCGKCRLDRSRVHALLAGLPAAPWRVENLAARVDLSRATLARRFTSLTGQSPMAYLAWWRMTAAAQLLRETDRSLPGIAAEVGYGSPYAFSHAFKRQFGLTPGRYRTIADPT